MERVWWVLEQKLRFNEFYDNNIVIYNVIYNEIDNSERYSDAS